MSQVFLKRGTYQDFLKNPHSIIDGLSKIDFAKNFKKDDFLGLKIHFGEKGNKSYINPTLLIPLVRYLQKIKTRPFLFETNTLYRGQRSNSVDHINLAYAHGFGKLNIPVIIGDGILGNDGLAIEINKKHFKQCFIASALKDIESLLVLSHFTGHMLAGFGAAIKNLGMGCAARKGKFAQHCEVSPKINSSRCIGCGECMENCLAKAIQKEADKCFIIKERCVGCAQCVHVCPQAAVNIGWSESYNLIGEKMAEYALATATKVSCCYVNFLLYITKECDCMNKEDAGIVPDLGVVFSKDPVAIDKASIDLILAYNNKDVLKDIHPQIDYLHHLKYAESIGLGKMQYTLEEF